MERQTADFLQEIFVQNRTKPFQDPQDLSDFCHACSSFNSLLNIRSGYACAACHSHFVYCPVSFEHLPLVEFHLPPDISQTDALTYLATEKPTKTAAGTLDNLMTFNQSAGTSGAGNDRFFADFNRTGIVVVSQQILRDLREEEVVVLRRVPPLRWRFYRNMLADVARVVACPSCWKIFNFDDYFAAVLELECCPFCREPVVVKSDD